MRIVIVIACLCHLVIAQLEKTRWQFLEDEMKMSVGGKITLKYALADEIFMNSTLMGWKFEELDYAYENPQYFNFSRSYFEYRDYLETSAVYQFMKAMPKGALLHVHAIAIVSSDYWVYNITYREGLYICQENKIKLRFSDAVPKLPCEKTWKLLKDVRKEVKDVKKYDEELKKSFTLDKTDAYRSGVEVWTRFLDIFTVIGPLWSYRPVWEDYLYEALRTLKDDNVMYVELRNDIISLYELDGSEHDTTHFVNTTKRVVDQFVKDFPEFFGAKLICAFDRNKYKRGKDIVADLNLAKSLKIMFPDFIAGFDIVNYEDKGQTLVRYYPHLEAAKNELNYFFHAGETNWYGMDSDQNLVDAVLLGSKRIGHANALMKHPAVLTEVLKHDIGLEVNVVSNSVLGLGTEVRTHPLASWLAAGLPVTLSSDDPGLWGARPLSTDFYVAFVGVASRNHDLRLLKQLALNSLRYSALSPKEKDAAVGMFNRKWDDFLRACMAGVRNMDFRAMADKAKKEMMARAATVESNASYRGVLSSIKLLLFSITILIFHV